MEYVYNLYNINKASKLVIDNIKTTVVRIDGKILKCYSVKFN